MLTGVEALGVLLGPGRQLRRQAAGGGCVRQGADGAAAACMSTASQPHGVLPEGRHRGVEREGGLAAVTLEYYSTATVHEGENSACWLCGILKQ